MNSSSIFNISNEEEFNKKALEVFHYQYYNIMVYKKFVDYLSINPTKITHYKNIPFLPIESFKTHVILHKDYPKKKYFQSSGTTSKNLSKHFIADEKLYDKSALLSFTNFVENPKDCIILALLPSYLERENSSLIYMVKQLMKISNQPENKFYLYEEEELQNILQFLENSEKKIILFGVSFALLDFIEKCTIPNHNLTVIETGGMKGRKKEITKNEVLKKLSKGFPNANITSEYGMTELFSQAYAVNSLQYQSPKWMKVLIRELDDPFSFVPAQKSGAINIIDLANINTCSFIATQDLGKCYPNGSFEILGRIDYSDIRGCSLLL